MRLPVVTARRLRAIEAAYAELLEREQHAREEAERAYQKADRARLDLIEQAAELDARTLQLEGIIDDLRAANAALQQQTEQTEKARQGQRRLEEQLRRAQKMEAVGRLAGGVAHDFNNLLTVIGTSAEFLHLALPKEDDRRHDTANIVAAVERAAGLTRQLLAFSRQQVVQPRVFDLGSLIREAQNILRPLVGETIELVLKLDTVGPLVDGDPGQIEQALVNLVVNARDAIPSTGSIIIKTAVTDLDEVYVAEYPDAHVGRHSVLSLTDTGTGMTAEVLSHLFEPFFTTKEPGKGTGLGLPTVYGIVQQTGGHITVYSAQGVGTTFNLYFPAVTGKADHTMLSSPQEPELPRAKGETVLVVEDDPAVRRTTCRILRTRGYNVLEAGDGNEAVTVAQQHAGDIHVLLTDVVLQGLGGREIADTLEPSRPGMTTIFMSGYAPDALLKDRIRQGTRFVEKPFSSSTLLRTIASALGARETPSRTE